VSLMKKWKMLRGRGGSEELPEREKDIKGGQHWERDSRRRLERILPGFAGRNFLGFTRRVARILDKKTNKITYSEARTFRNGGNN